MNFSEQPPSKQWAAVKYGGEKVAEVWFKPEGEPFGLTFRIRRERLQIPGMGKRLTVANLLKTVGIATEEVESWGHGGLSHPILSGSDPEVRRCLPLPPKDATHLSIHVSLKPPRQVAPKESAEAEGTPTKWQELKTRWGAILGSEATIDISRITLEGLQAELEASSKAALTVEEKVHAQNADVALWTKAKSRAHFALPKVKEFIHRATWALGAPERKKLDEVFKDPIPPDIPIPEMDKLAEELEILLKERQVLSADGATVHQECRSILAEIQGTLRTLQSNAARKADKKRREAGPKGKFFKDFRRLSGVE